MALDLIIFPLIGWTIIIGCVWITVWLFMAVRDRRPKEGIRCRKCFYNLYRIEHNTCPECGADLTKTGVWAEGQPKRGPIIHIMSLVGWVVYVLMALWMQRPYAFSAGLVDELSWGTIQAISICFLFTGWLIPLAVGLQLRRRRNNRAILSWPINGSKEATTQG
ncbi:hypothetical protein OT109_16350 [Phycisphaeraceae bacterium D3-23]